MTAAQRYRKKPIEIDAIQWDGTNVADIMQFMPRGGFIGGTVRIHTLEGVLTAHPGDWIIRGTHGEYYPCKPHIFAQTYEPI